MKKQTLFFIGFMGTGKSAVAEKLAQKLNKNFIELDQLIEKKEKKSISELFIEKGEPYFRRVERQILKSVLKKKNAIISTGGGIVLNNLNIEDMKQHGRIICLTASQSEIYKRTTKKRHRPLLNEKNPFQTIKKLLQSRRPLYRRAGELFFSTTDKRAAQVAKEIQKRLEREK